MALPLSLVASEKVSRVWARVDLGAYAHNVRQILKLLKHSAGLMAVVKANAYGHGAVQVARAVVSAGAQRLGVVSVAQGMELREGGLRAPIQLLGPCVPEELRPGIEVCLTFAVSSQDEIAALADRARAVLQGRRRGERAKVHLLVDTGMGRGGFAPDELWPAAERVLAEKTLELEGAFTHFSSAEEPDPGPTREQVALFRWILHDLRERRVALRVRHAANSAATVFHPQSHLDMVRCGALLHGLRAWPAERDGLDLRPTLSLYSRILHIGKRPPGWTVGYNRRYRCEQESLLATLAVGYSDGYRRSLTGRGEVLIRGRRCRVLGTISMDFIVVDVTELARGAGGLPEAGEEVVLIGASADGRERITVEDIANMSGTIPYVVTTGLGADLERRFVGGLAAAERTQAGEMELRHVELPRERRAVVPLKRFAEEEQTAERRAAGA